MDLPDFQNHLNQFMKERNSRSLAEFEGYSPDDMYLLLYATYSEKSPIRLLSVSESDVELCPIARQTFYFLNLIQIAGEVKLTAKGFLPTAVVKEISEQRFLDEWPPRPLEMKIYKEMDAVTIHLTRLLAEIAGLTKKRNGKLSLTKKGIAALDNKGLLVPLLFENYTQRFNWAYQDYYEKTHIGQMGFGFTLILLARYGRETRPATFYAEKYFNAFPDLKNQFLPATNPVDRYTANCYILRTFERFLHYFGLVELEARGDWRSREIFLHKTPLFDRFIRVNN